jgi:hypothetical protein
MVSACGSGKSRSRRFINRSGHGDKIGYKVLLIQDL